MIYSEPDELNYCELFNRGDAKHACSNDCALQHRRVPCLLVSMLCLRESCFTTRADRVFRMIESEMAQLIVVAEPDLSAWHAGGPPESSPYPDVWSWVESNYCAAGSFGTRDSGEDRLRVTFFEICDPLLRPPQYGNNPMGLTAERRAN